MSAKAIPLSKIPVRRRLRLFILSNLGASFYWLMKSTWRVRFDEHPEFVRDLASHTPMVIAHWHGDELAILHLLPRYRAAAMTSTSQDGELMDRLVNRFGGKTSRGSSTRGGVSALKGILRLAKSGYRPSVAVDGPKGPIYKVKPGIFEISKITGGVIYPLSVACDRSFVFKKAWNKTFLPLPFAKIAVSVGQALPAVSREQDAHDPALALRLEQALTNAQHQARNLVAAPS